MSDHLFSQRDEAYPALDVLSVDPSDPFQSSNIHNVNTPANDPSPVDTQPQWNQNNDSISNLNSDLFPHGPLPDNAWSQPQSHSSAAQFWRVHNDAHSLQGHFGSETSLPPSSLDIPQAMASISAAATPAQYQQHQPLCQLPNPIYDAFNTDQATPQFSQQGYQYQPILFANTPQLSDNGQLHQALSRQSSYSSFTSLSNDGFTSTSNEGLFDLSRTLGNGNGINHQLLPPFQPTPKSNSSRPTLPPIQVNVFTPPGKMNRPRSNSRMAPYNRHGRSTSISTVGSFDGIPPSSANTYASFQSPSLASPYRGLAHGLNKMSLHHRRTSSKNSNYSTVKKQPSRSILSRSNRSASMSFLRASDSAPFDFSDSPSLTRGSGHSHARVNSHNEGEISEALLQKALDVRSIASSVQQDKARSQWVKDWLQASYTWASGCTVPRQGMHHAYVLASSDYGLTAINAASFGKAVRAAFPGIKNRRLGHRGNSKYHFVSIRPTLAIEAQRLNEFGEHHGTWVPAANGTFGFRPSTEQGLMSMDTCEDVEGDDDDCDDDEGEAGDYFPIKKSASSIALSQAVRTHRLTGSDDYSPRQGVARPRLGLRRHTTSLAPSPPNFQQLAQSTTRVYDLDNFPSWEEVKVACPLQSESEMRAFWQGFEQHQQDLVQCIERQAFDEFEHHCRQYWFPAQFAHLCEDQDLSRMVHQAKAVTYDHIIGILLKMSDSIDESSCESLKELGLALEETMETAYSNYSLEFKVEKLVLGRNAAHLMQRVSETSRVVSALKSLSNNNIASRMESTWHALDFQAIVDQCVFSSACDADIVHKVLRDFGAWLDATAEGMVRSSTQLAFKAIRKMTLWLDTLLEHFVHDGSIQSLPTKCTFLTSQISRAIILKSDTNFGTFQLLKTYVDDYITIAAARREMFAIHKSNDFNDPHSPLLELHQGLSVDIPRLGDGTFGSDPATAVPVYRTQQQHFQHSVNDGHVDPALLNDFQSTGLDDNMAGFRYSGQQMDLHNHGHNLMDQYLPKIEQ